MDDQEDDYQTGSEMLATAVGKLAGVLYSEGVLDSRQLEYVFSHMDLSAPVAQGPEDQTDETGVDETETGTE